MGIIIAAAFSRGYLAIPGALGIAVIYALEKDKRLWDAIFGARRRFPRV